jgi:hypothetical protein
MHASSDGAPYIASAGPTQGFAIDCTGQVILAVIAPHQDYDRLKRTLTGYVPATVTIEPDQWRGEARLSDEEPGRLAVLLSFFSPADHAAFIQSFRSGASLNLRIIDVQFATPLDGSAEAWLALQDACAQAGFPQSL